MLELQNFVTKKMCFCTKSKNTTTKKQNNIETLET